MENFIADFNGVASLKRTNHSCFLQRSSLEEQSVKLAVVKNVWRDSVHQYLVIIMYLLKQELKQQYEPELLQLD